MVDQQSTHKPYRLYEEDVKQNTKKKKNPILVSSVFQFIVGIHSQWTYTTLDFNFDIKKMNAVKVKNKVTEMEVFKIFGCENFLSAGRIIAFISLMESLVKILITTVFIMWIKYSDVETSFERGSFSLIKSLQFHPNSSLNP